MLLTDANVFLEILLEQEHANECQTFLDSNSGTLYVSDFALHSVGVNLFRLGCPSAFTTFLKEVLPAVQVVSLPLEAYFQVMEISSAAGLDFDDACQTAVAKVLGLRIVTMDRDFDRVRHLVEVVSPLE